VKKDGAFYCRFGSLRKGKWFTKYTTTKFAAGHPTLAILT